MGVRLLFVSLLLSATAHASIGVLGRAESALIRGPHQNIDSQEYKLPAELDPFIHDESQTELWARMVWPRALNAKAPVVFFLHGNHATCGTGQNPRQDNNCEYTQKGTCPEGYTVVPNHAGYQYLMEHLASWGVISVSINANRGINCGSGRGQDWGLNLARGRLILKHISFLQNTARDRRWDSTLPPAARLIRWSDVGFFGHSRGGEGIRAALYYLQNPQLLPQPAPPLQALKVKGLFEVGAVDGQTSVVLDAPQVAWNQILPACDADVSSLEGRNPFERMRLRNDDPLLSEKSLTTIWGANHNFFNTEWQVSDSSGCHNHSALFPGAGGSAEQRLIATHFLTAFFIPLFFPEGRGLELLRNFNPLYALPELIDRTTRVQREHFVARPEQRSFALEEFTQSTGLSQWGGAIEVHDLQFEHLELFSLVLKTPAPRGARLSWTAAGQNKQPLIEIPVTAPGQSLDLTNFLTLEFRLAQFSSSTPRPQPRIWLSLVDDRGRSSQELDLSFYGEVSGPAHSSFLFEGFRVPLVHIREFSLQRVQKVRLRFQADHDGDLVLSGLRAGTHLGQSILIPESWRVRPLFSPVRQIQRDTREGSPLVLRGSFLGRRPVLTPRGIDASMSEFVFRLTRPLPVGGALPILQAGRHQIRVSRFTRTDLTEIAFRLPAQEAQKLPAGTRLSMRIGERNPLLFFDLGIYDPRLNAKESGK